MQSCLCFFQSKVRFFKFCFQQKVVRQQKCWQSYVTDSNLVATCFILGFPYYKTITTDKVSVKSLLQSLCFFLGWSEENDLTTILYLFLDKISNSQPLVAAYYWYHSDLLRVFFPYEVFAWSYHFYSQIECISIIFYSNLLSHHFICVRIRCHQVEDWVLLAALGGFFSVIFSSKIGQDISVGLRQNGAHRKHGVLT